MAEKTTKDNLEVEELEKNRTLDRDYTNNTYFKNRYLLKGFVFCGYCDRPFYGKVLKSGDHYYYHNKPKCGHIDCVKGIRLEPPVLAEVASRFSDSKKAEEAIKFRLPDQTERNDLKAELKQIKRTISKLDREKNNYLDRIGKGAFSDELQDRANKVESDIEASDIRRKQIHNRLSQIPDPDDQMSKIAFQTMQKIIRSHFRNPSRILDMSFDDKRKMLEHVFSGRDEEGKKHGIYLKRGEKHREYIFELKWIFKFNEIGTVMVPDDRIMEMLGLDKKEYIQLFKQLQTKNRFYGKEKTGVQGQINSARNARNLYCVIS
jgi:hypothetical protein